MLRVCQGHFTQLVWKSSRDVGIGRSQSRDGKWFVVANFFPAGNFVGRNAENVFPPRDGKVVIPVMDSKTPTQGDLSNMQWVTLCFAKTFLTLVLDPKIGLKPKLSRY